MSKRNVRSFFNKIVSFVAIAALVAVYVPNLASAAAITNRKVVIGSSQLSALTTYVFTFNVPSGTSVGSADFQACTTASGTCTPAPGFSSSAGPATLTSQPTTLGSASGWTINTGTANDLKISATAAAAPGGTSTVSFTNVTNPSSANATFFMRITTYTGTTGSSPWTGVIDTGVVAAATAGQITVTANVDESLTFTLSAATVALGTLTTGTTGKDGTTTMVAATNGGTGYSITYTGNSLTSPSGALPAYASSASAAGTAGFGFNLMSNTTPSVGTGVSGSGSGTAFTGYGTANAFTFNSGDKIASASAATNSNTYTVSYVANVAGATPAGSYTTTLNYVATPNF
ncbi:MAG: exported protein of unknown function [Candidatus Saccharibacteria bacterium]|nr:exported protein of unknown function [Candidatus Saccharibacteria bacterium]